MAHALQLPGLVTNWNLAVSFSVLLLGCAVSPPTVTAIAGDQHDIRSVVTTSNGVYWTDHRFGSQGDRVMHAQLGGVDVAYDAQLCLQTLVADQVSLFWVRCDGAIVTAPMTTGTTTVLVDPGTFSVQSLVETSDTLYITTLSPGQIVAVSKQQGIATATVVATLTEPGALAVDDTNLYWLDEGDAAVYQRARTADPVTPPTRLATLDTNTSMRQIDAIATDGVYLYWSDAKANQAHAMRLSDGTRFELATSASADAFALDASHVYWISGNAAKVELAPLAGGETELVALVTDHSGYPTAAIALTDDSAIYADNPTDCDPTITDCYPNTIESVSK